MFIRILQGGSSSQAVLGTGACGVKAACEVFGRKGKLRLFFHVSFVSFVSFVQSTNLMKNTGPEE